MLEHAHVHAHDKLGRAKYQCSRALMGLRLRHVDLGVLSREFGGGSHTHDRRCSIHIHPHSMKLDLNESSSQPDRGGGHRREHAIEHSEMSWASGHVDVPPSLPRAHVARATAYFSKSIFPIIHVITNMMRYRLPYCVSSVLVLYRDNIIIAGYYYWGAGPGAPQCSDVSMLSGLWGPSKSPNTRHACVHTHLKCKQ